MSMSAQSKGLAGTIIDGPVRDPMEIQTLGYPVFCRGITPYRAAKESYGRINVPVEIGNLSIRPNDLVLADANGIVAIPRVRAREIVHLAEEIARKENDIKTQIVGGRTIFEVFSLLQYVPISQQPQAKRNN
jgi:4-hydroxy-4-methyl-2-oxoglutarate aldolase